MPEQKQQCLKRTSKETERASPALSSKGSSNAASGRGR
nr:MAG TPA: hypothetical protein [Caudoviricetes sp.]